MERIYICFINILVDGFWLNWSNWSACSKSCGRGFMYRTRVCEDPKYGGSECVGFSNETMPCNPSSCPGMYPRLSIAIVRFCAHLLLCMYIFINLQIIFPVLILLTYCIIYFLKWSSTCPLRIETYEIISYDKKTVVALASVAVFLFVAHKLNLSSCYSQPFT